MQWTPEAGSIFGPIKIELSGILTKDEIITITITTIVLRKIIITTVDVDKIEIDPLLNQDVNHIVAINPGLMVLIIITAATIIVLSEGDKVIITMKTIVMACAIAMIITTKGIHIMIITELSLTRIETKAKGSKAGKVTTIIMAIIGEEISMWTMGLT